jgi:hypothetical protein
MLTEKNARTKAIARRLGVGEEVPEVQVKAGATEPGADRMATRSRVRRTGNGWQATGWTMG